MIEINIRRARAADVHTALPLIYSSGPEAFEYIFTNGDLKALDFLGAAFVSGRGLFGYNNHFVAEHKDEVVAAVAIYSAAEYNRYGLDVALQICRFYPLSAWRAVLARSLNTRRWMPPPARRMEYVANFGVAASMRGRGVGRQILDYGLRRARDRGKQLYALDVAANNPRAQALYESYGMQLVSEQASPAVGMVPASRRLCMPVTP